MQKAKHLSGPAPVPTQRRRRQRRRRRSGGGSCPHQSCPSFPHSCGHVGEVEFADHDRSTKRNETYPNETARNTIHHAPVVVSCFFWGGAFEAVLSETTFEVLFSYPWPHRQMPALSGRGVPEGPTYPAPERGVGVSPPAVSSDLTCAVYGWSIS